MILTILITLPRYGPDHPDHPHCDHPDDPQSNGEPGKLQRVLRAATSRRRVSFWVEILAGGIIHIMHKVISNILHSVRCCRYESAICQQILAGGIIPNV